ncbi:hypothetical protein RHGRI_016519 [Rhododendron griersonianum]|uniref:Uncharacterized protein n=1 Tax=Rhododendron griersonianum TaxID=479676 RepID=A0AAV6JUD9_9ERIC|nr:hypothetical protein RHGRI_016519 [Rhododendron griersonianum]
MASTSFHLLHPIHLRRVRNAPPPISCTVHPPRPAPPSRTAVLPGRRQWLLLLTAATTTLKAAELPSMAQDIPLFGLRKKLKKVEEEAEEVIKEGIESAEKGIEIAEKGIETAEKGIETAEREIESAVSFGGLAQAVAVAAAEVVGVVAATSVVNGTRHIWKEEERKLGKGNKKMENEDEH